MDIRLPVADHREADDESLRFARRTTGHRATRLALRLALGGALASSWSTVTHAEWLFDVDAGARYDSNLTQAQQDADVRADAAATLFASGGYFLALSGADRLTLAVNAASETWHRFHDINQVLIGGSASYKHKFGVGYAVPWLSLALSGSHVDSRSAIRDSDLFRARAELGQRFIETFDASIGVVYDRRRADDDLPVVPGISGKVFDVRGHSAFVHGGYAVSEQLLLGANFAVRRGDVVSSTRQNLDIFLASSAIAADPAFGDDFFAYRLKGTTRTATLSSSWALSDRSSLNFGYTDDRTRAYDGLDYRGRVAELSFTYSY
jgi:hypothetical protein